MPDFQVHHKNSTKMEIKQHSQFANYREVVIDDKPIFSIANNRATEAEFEKFLNLIAAAPKTLEALIMAYSFMVTDPQHQGRQILETLREAINAATGEAESNMHQIFQDALKPFGIK